MIFLIEVFKIWGLIFKEEKRKKCKDQNCRWKKSVGFYLYLLRCWDFVERSSFCGFEVCLYVVNIF